MMIRLKTILNELKLNDLVGNQYKYVIGSSEEKHIGENDKKYVLEMIEKSLKTYLYDEDFALNYLDGSQRKEYNSFFEREVLTPMLKKVDFTLNNFFVLDGDKVKWKFSSNDTRKMVDEIFRKNSKVPSDIKKKYYEYRLEYAGVKLKEGVNESDLKGYLIADVVDDIIKAIGPRLVSGEIKQSDRNKIYLKLTDVKVGSGVVKLLKSKFGIDAKEEMFGGKDKFGSIPSVSFFANKVINEAAAAKTPDFIVTSIPATAIPSTNISKADVGLGLAMFDGLGRGWTLNNKDYKLDYHNGKVALVLTKQGKLAVRVKSGHDPKYVQKIEKFANDYLSKYAKDIKK
jgi:hypothetical protein